MPTNKIVYGNQTLMDLTSDTVTPNDVMSGVTFHDRSGATQTGSLSLDEYATIDLLEDTVGWTGKNKASSYKVFPSTVAAYNPVLCAEAELQGNTDYILSFNTDNSGNTYYTNEKLFATSTSFSADGTRHSISVKTKSTISISDTNQYSSGNGWIIAKNSASQSSAPSFSDVMIQDASILDTTYEPYHPSVEQTLRDAEVIEGKNKLHIPDSIVTQTINGVTFTVNRNSDGEVISIVANGTASAQTVFSLYHENHNCPYIGNAILSGCPSGGSGSTYDLRITDDTTSTNTDFGNGVNVDIANTGSWTVAIMIRNGQVCNNLVFKPMLRYATETDTTFEPYYIPLKDSKFDRAEQRVLGAKNLLKYPYAQTTKTVSGITYTDNGDGSITISGTASANDNFQFANNTYTQSLMEKLKGKRVILTGGISANIKLQLWYQNIPASIADIGNGVEFTFPDLSVAWNIAIVVLKDTAISSPITIKPMIRLASDPDDTYAPYAMTNRELTDAISSGGSGHTMTPTPSASLTEQNVVTAVNAALVEGGINDDVPSNFDMGKWSNTMTKAFLVQGVAGSSTPVGTSGVGTWPADINNPTSAEKADWMCIPQLYGCGSVLGIKFDLVYDPHTVSIPIARGGYVIDDNETMSDGQGGTINCAKVCLKFANEISEADTHTAVVGVEITIKRTETVFVG